MQDARHTDCVEMPPCAQDEFSGVQKRAEARPLITLEQLHEHKKPGDLWIGERADAAGCGRVTMRSCLHLMCAHKLRGLGGVWHREKQARGMHLQRQRFRVFARNAAIGSGPSLEGTCAPPYDAMDAIARREGCDGFLE